MLRWIGARAGYGTTHKRAYRNDHSRPGLVAARFQDVQGFPTEFGGLLSG
jgi:hypothetical protein